MGGLSSKSFDDADETRTPDKTRVDVVRLSGATVARFTFQPGWRWSECVKPVVGTESCQARHVGALVSGRLHVVHEDGSAAEVGSGEAYVIEPGHDAWVVVTSRPSRSSSRAPRHTHAADRESERPAANGTRIAQYLGHSMLIRWVNAPVQTA
jgi:hypothetical protein